MPTAAPRHICHLTFAICHLPSRYNAPRENVPPPTVRERLRAVADHLSGDGGVVGAELLDQRYLDTVRPGRSEDQLRLERRAHLHLCRSLLKSYWFAAGRRPWRSPGHLELLHATRKSHGLENVQHYEME